eukprot:scaffold88013_cov38-Prasinocladus_malaysianus.AAC.1
MTGCCVLTARKDTCRAIIYRDTRHKIRHPMPEWPFYTGKTLKMPYVYDIIAKWEMHCRHKTYVLAFAADCLDTMQKAINEFTFCVVVDQPYTNNG